MILRSPVLGPRIVPFGESRLPSDRLPNGRQGFRATQLFHHVNKALPPQFNPHRALDIGNATTPCSRVDAVLAPISGHGRSWHDNATQLNLGARTNGLGFMIHAPDGSRVNLHHLSGYTVPTGRTVEVRAGQQIGWVGNTGIGNVCHLHIDVWNARNVKVDPWPLLEQNQEADVKLQGTWREGYARGSTVTVNARLRERPDLTSQTLAILPAGSRVDALARVSGEVVADSANWYPVIARVDADRVFGYLHGSTHKLDPIPVLDCSDDVKAATLALTNQLAGARTAVRGARQAIIAADEALT